MEGYFGGHFLGELEYLRFREKDGKLYYEYKKRISIPTKVHAAVYRSYVSSGPVPDEIFQAGDSAIRPYVEAKIAEDVKIQEAKHKAHDEFAKNPNFDVAVEYDGKVLKGKITSADDSTLRVGLDEPYQGEEFVIYGFGAAMAKMYIFAKGGGFSEDAIQTARNLLIRIYQKQKHYEEHRGVIDTAARLNQEITQDKERKT